MKVKIDENLPAEIAADLRALGHDAMTVWSIREWPASPTSD